MARKLAELLGFNRDVRPFYAACRFDELSRGSVSCLLNASFGKRFHNATTRFFRPKIDDHGIHQSNIGQILAQWWCPVASKVALDMLHWAMRLASHRGIVIAIKMARKSGPFFSFVDFMSCITVAKRSCYG
jgi:hypothetical protein